MINLNDVPFDLLRETTAALALYVRAQRKRNLLQERTRLQRELDDTRVNLVEIQALVANTDRPPEETNHV